MPPGKSINTLVHGWMGRQAGGAHGPGAAQRGPEAPRSEQQRRTAPAGAPAKRGVLPWARRAREAAAPDVDSPG
jgi:hypothetical protein